MSDEHDKITDEQLGDAIRRIADRIAPDRGPDSFQWYARELVRAADMLDDGSWVPGKLNRIRVWVDPVDQLDGLIERWLEMLTGIPVGVTGFDRLGRAVEGDPEKLAQLFHELYERLAPAHGYETRRESAKPWSEVPEKNRELMIAVCEEILSRTAPHHLELDVDRLGEVARLVNEVLGKV